MEIELRAHSPLATQRTGQSAVLFVSSILFAMMGIQVKAVTSLLPPAERLPDLEVTFTRFAFGLVVMIILAAMGRVRLQSERPIGLLLRGIFGTIAIALYFYSITHTQLGKGTLLSYTYFIFAPLFSALWLRERPHRAAVASLVAATVGILLLVRPDFRGINPGDIAGLISGLFAGMAITTIRELRRTESAPVIFFALCLCGAVGLGIMLLLMHQGWIPYSVPPRLPQPHALALLIGVGVTGTAGQIILTWGYRYVSTTLGSLISISTIPLSALAGVLLFGESLHWTTLVGAVLVLAAGVSLSLVEGTSTTVGHERDLVIAD